MLFISSSEVRMAFHVFLFLLVCFLMLCLAWLCRPSLLHRGLAHWRAGAVHPVVRRLLKPRTPRDCPACCVSSTFSAGAALVRGQKPAGCSQTHRHAGLCLSQPPVSVPRQH